jgi:hypothetical protein
MNAVSWLTGAAMLGGGAACAGLLFAIYRRPKDPTGAHLRMELISANDKLRATIEDARSLIMAVGQSQDAITRATAQVGGDLQLFIEKWQADHWATQDLANAVRATGASYAKLDQAALEAALAEVNALRLKAATLRERYVGAIAARDRATRRARECRSVPAAQISVREGADAFARLFATPRTAKATEQERLRSAR